MRTSIQTFIEVHVNDPTPLTTQLEALKCVLRGMLIQHVARLKREHSLKFERLLSRIYDLETAYKRSQSPHTYAHLVQAREQLHSLLDQSYTRFRHRNKHFFYESVNKCGWPLARSLHPRLTSTYTQKLKSPDGPDIYARKKSPIASSGITRTCTILRAIFKTCPLTHCRLRFKPTLRRPPL